MEGRNPFASQQKPGPTEKCLGTLLLRASHLLPLPFTSQQKMPLAIQPPARSQEHTK
nr:hypothetical protein Q903MT_gene6264 [Picea sitchensis]